MSEPASDLIPAELVNLRSIYERRFARRKEALDDKQREVIKALEPLVAAHRAAVRACEDHFDEGLLKYGRDPNRMAIGERDPNEVKQARHLKREVEDAEAAVRNKESDLTAQVKSLIEYQTFRTAQTELEDWLSKICIHLHCCPNDLDWQGRTIKRRETTGQMPKELLAIPDEHT